MSETIIENHCLSSLSISFEIFGHQRLLCQNYKFANMPVVLYFEIDKPNRKQLGYQ